MFFKNIILYRLVDEFTLSRDTIQEKLITMKFYPCPKSENFSVGWVSPYGGDSDSLVHSLKGFYLLCFCKEEKILPSSVIKEELDKKIELIQKAEDRVVYRKEKKELRDQIIINLRHQAFSRKRLTFVYIDAESRYLIVDTASRNKAEEVSSYLRKTLGSLKLALPETQTKPENTMTEWLKEQQIFPAFNIQNNCDMLDPKQKKAMIKCKDHDLNSQEIISHLHTGKQVVKMALKWQNKISFDLSDDFSIKKIKFLELIQQRREEIKDQSQKDQLDADFAIMTGEFSQFFQDLWPLFDGLTVTENS